jgi:para-aminobenzoate synthetase component 1
MRGARVEERGVSATEQATDPGREFPLVEELSPAPEPMEVCRRLAHLPHLLFLDSAGRYPTLSRYSFVTADPFAWLWSRGRQVGLTYLRPGACVVQESTGDPFAVLAGQLADFPARTLPDLPPFQGGAAGLFGYDLCHHIERLPRPRHDEFAVPDLAVGLYDWVFAFDHQEQRAWVVSTGLPMKAAKQRHRRAVGRLQDVHRLLRERGRDAETRHASARRPELPPLTKDDLVPLHPLPGLSGVCSNFRREDYLAAVARAVEYIHAGDCFQVNVAQRLLHPATLPPLELYERLRRRNPAPFAGYFDLGDFVLASASPERFLRVAGGAVQTRPIKGTRPRGRTLKEDRQRAEELLASAKDRAENVMIVDLLRNDLGRVCAYGSVTVPAVCRLESFEYVHHLVSEVHGRLRPGLGPIDLLRAAFPGGSVTGAPKVRAMEIIAELEPTARGPYCGSLGYIGFDGGMDTNILIRTFTLGRGWAQFPVGGGIVADSTPENEYAETLHKAEGLVRAL